jgi:hypothetical protein
MSLSKIAVSVLGVWTARSRYEKILIVLFLLTTPFLHSRVRMDGTGYYAYLRSPLIDHNLQFASDWNGPPVSLFYDCRVCSSDAKLYWNHPANALLFVFLNSHIYVNPITKTGHLPNFYTVGPAILWFPFVASAHLAVLGANRLGFAISADGHSWPYILALSIATNLYGFLAIFISFHWARKFVAEIWAFWAALGVWFASSLPIYMYFEPSWSHAHSAFCVALFLWYWHRTRVARTRNQWLLLGLLAGLMVDVYLPNAIFVLAPASDCLLGYSRAWRERREDPSLWWLNLRLHTLSSASALIAFSPMLITRQIVYGNPLALGMYAGVSWNWRSPNFRAVLFSANHGLFVWTPILLLAVLGLLALYRQDRQLGAVCMLAAVLFYGLISVYPWWDGRLAFGNRFFVSLTPVFVLGLASLFSWSVRLWGSQRSAARRLIPITALLILWNLGLVYQFSTTLVPHITQVYWDEVLFNQFRVVPQQVLSDVSAKVTRHL